MSAYDKTSIQINRCKRILELVDTYVDCPTQDHRTTLRRALMEEFEAPSIAPPVAAGSGDTIRTMIGTYRHLPKIHSDEAWDARQAHMDAIMNSISAWGAQQREEGKQEAISEMMDINRRFLRRAVKAEARVKELEAEDQAMHRKLAAETLRADQGWARYEAANRAKNDLEREKAGSASPFFDGLPNEIQHHPV